MSARYAVVWIGIVMSLGCFPDSAPPSTASSSTPAPSPASSSPSTASSTPAAAPAASASPSLPAASSPAPATTPAATPGSTPAATASTSPAVPAFPAAAATPAPGTPGTPATTDPAASAPPPGTERVTAKAGEGKKGQSLKNDTGIFVEPAKAFFRVEQRTVFEFQIPQALGLFKASEGRAPKSHDEFMTKIVAANNIKLPELPAGNKYVYDPQREELMVEKPVKK